MSTSLTSRIHLANENASDLEPEDYLSSAIGVIFPNDLTNQHGDPGTDVIYLSPLHGEIRLALADPDPEHTMLFSHFVWNSAVQLAVFIEGEPVKTSNANADADPGLPSEECSKVGGGVGGREWEVKGQNVLELGAGTGLVGLVAALAGAQRVVISDYPAVEVLENLRGNVERNIDHRRSKGGYGSEEERQKDGELGAVTVEGHEWGVLTDGFAIKEKEGFDVVLVADCLWMPHQHTNLLSSIRWFLSPQGRAWVVAGFHTGRKIMKGFFATDVLEAAGLEVERIWEREANGREREWKEDRGKEDLEKKWWLAVAILKRRGGK